MVDKRNVQKVVDEFNKRHGAGVAIQLSEQRNPETVSTGVPMLDYALGGGWGKNTQNLVWGSFSTGKSVLSIQTIVALQHSDPDALACIVDIENTTRDEWLEKLGVDTSRVVILRPVTAEDALTQTMYVFTMNVFSVIVFDSLGALAKQRDVYGKDGKGAKGEEASYGGSSMIITRLANDILACEKELEIRHTTGEDVILPVVLYIGQVRDNVDSMYVAFKLSGGNAIKHAMSSIVYLAPNTGNDNKIMGEVGGVKMQIGKKITARVEKNKEDAPGRMAGFDLIYLANDHRAVGVARERSLYDLAVFLGVIDVRGAWNYYREGEEGAIKSQGADNTVELLRNNVEFFDAVKTDIDVIRAKEK